MNGPARDRTADWLALQRRVHEVTLTAVRRRARRRAWLAFLIGVVLGALLPAIAGAQRVDERWKRIAHDGFDAPAWVFHVLDGTASAGGYGAARLVGLRPAHSAALVTGVGIGIHLRGWAMGEYRPSLDWAFNVATRGGPAIALAVCETRGRRACVLAIGAVAGAYLVLLPHASP